LLLIISGELFLVFGRENFLPWHPEVGVQIIAQLRNGVGGIRVEIENGEK